jgi:hypothetical protein
MISNEECGRAIGPGRRYSAVCLVLTLVFAGLPLWASEQASAEEYRTGYAGDWNGFHPGKTGVYSIDQTVANAYDNGFIEIGLSATVNTLSCVDVSGGAGRTETDVIVDVLGTANSRLGMDYSVAYGSTKTIKPSGLATVSELQNKDNAGCWRTLPTGKYIRYLGGWYDALWITTNGFIVLETRSHYPKVDTTKPEWTSGTPSIPSTSSPNLIIAPYWKDMETKTVSGVTSTISCGLTGSGSGSGSSAKPWYYVVCWENLYDKGGSAKNSFSTYLAVIDDTAGRVTGVSYFAYGSVLSNAGTVAVGFEDQDGRGKAIPPDPKDSKYVGKKISLVDTAGNNYRIRAIKIEAIKTPETGSDANAKVDICGYYTESGGSTSYPGGSNVELYKKQSGNYAGDSALQFCFDMTTTFLPMLVPEATLPIAAIQVIVSSYELLSALNPAVNTDIQDSVYETRTAYCQNLALDALVPNYNFVSGPKNVAYDVASAPRLIWHIQDGTGDHGLIIRETVTYNEVGYANSRSISTGTYSRDIELNLRSPGDGRQITWFQRTLPDARRYSFGLESPTVEGLVRQGYTVKHENYGAAIAPSDIVGYKIMGYSPIEQSNHYTARADGSISMDGYFYMNDDIDSCPIPGIPKATYRVLNAYALDPLNVRNVIATKSIYVSSDPVGQWNYKQVLFTQTDLGGVRDIRVGVGRPVRDSFSIPDFEAVAGWATVSVGSYKTIDQTTSDYYLGHVTVVGGVGDVKKGSVSGESAVGTKLYTKGVSATLYAVPNQDYFLDHWEWGPSHQNVGNSNPYTIGSSGGISFDWELRAVFALKSYSLQIATSPGCPQPVAGTYYYVPHTVVTLTATPSYVYGGSAYTFNHWVLWQGLWSFDQTVSITMDYSQWIEAAYNAVPIKILTLNTGQYYPYPIAGQYYYAPGQVAEFSALPVYTHGMYTYTWSHWHLDGVDYTTSMSISVTMNADHTLDMVYTRTGGIG